MIDFLMERYGNDIEAIRGWTFDYLNIWRGGKRRALGLSDAWGQELVYSSKFTQAQRWNADGPSHLLVPFYFAAETAAWLTASDSIEATYITAKLVIDVAESIEEIMAALSGLT